MSNGKTELFVFLGAAFATLIGLAVLHKWYGSYLDNRYHERLAEHGPAEGMVAARAEDQAKLQKGKIPLEQAMSDLAHRGRTSFNTISPSPSQDLSALSGWIHRPGFKPVTAHPIRAPHVAAATASDHGEHGEHDEHVGNGRNDGSDQAEAQQQQKQPAGAAAQPTAPAH
jgi:hypothetical protein